MSNTNSLCIYWELLYIILLFGYSKSLALNQDFVKIVRKFEKLSCFIENKNYPKYFHIKMAFSFQTFFRKQNPDSAAF
jgi:hypothetical protein